MDAPKNVTFSIKVDIRDDWSTDKIADAIGAGLAGCPCVSAAHLVLTHVGEMPFPVLTWEFEEA